MDTDTYISAFFERYRRVKAERFKNYSKGNFMIGIPPFFTDRDYIWLIIYVDFLLFPFFGLIGIAIKYYDRKLKKSIFNERSYLACLLIIVAYINFVSFTSKETIDGYLAEGHEFSREISSLFVSHPMKAAADRGEPWQRAQWHIRPSRNALIIPKDEAKMELIRKGYKKLERPFPFYYFATSKYYVLVFDKSPQDQYPTRDEYLIKLLYHGAPIIPKDEAKMRLIRERYRQEVFKDKERYRKLKLPFDDSYFSTDKYYVLDFHKSIQEDERFMRAILGDFSD